MSPEKPQPDLSDTEAFIQSVYADKKGRDVISSNPFTCYINTPFPQPDLPLLTASLLENLVRAGRDAFRWAETWDKSVVAVAPGLQSGCMFLASDDSRGKVFAPVSTTRPIDTEAAVAALPPGDLALIGLNRSALTTDAFLITYFHMVNELIWTLGLTMSPSGRPDPTGYQAAVSAVSDSGFRVDLVSEPDIIQIKKLKPDAPVRIYGSRVNPAVPEILGVILFP